MSTKKSANSGKDYYSKKFFHSPETYGELKDIPMTVGMKILSVASIIIQVILTFFAIYSAVKNVPIEALAYSGIPAAVIFVMLPFITWLLTFMCRFGCASIPLEMWRFPVSVREGIMISEGRLLKLLTLLVETETSICFLYLTIVLYLSLTPSNIIILIWVFAIVLSVYFPCKSAKTLSFEAPKQKRRSVDRKQ